MYVCTYLTEPESKSKERLTGVHGVLDLYVPVCRYKYWWYSDKCGENLKSKEQSPPTTGGKKWKCTASNEKLMRKKVIVKVYPFELIGLNNLMIE